MNSIEKHIEAGIIEAIKSLYNANVEEKHIQIQETRKDFEGDFTVVVFPLMKYSKKSPETTAEEIGQYLTEQLYFIDKYNVIKGFLNLVIDATFWKHFLTAVSEQDGYGLFPQSENAEKVVIEFSSPNTNKPLHLGHIRNNLLGDSLSRIMRATGKKVIKVNLVNDRGIHICKSMLAWQKWGNGETPQSSGMKGDHLVGKYYVMFEQNYKKEIKDLMDKGFSEEEAIKESKLLREAQKMLKRWERGNSEVRKIWETMNSWVYEGFDETYSKLGIKFDKIYYESETYYEGKQLVLTALKQGICKVDDTDAVYIDLTDEGLDRKILLRHDGTSVYITQDIGTAKIRFKEFNFDEHIYVVGNEQDYHFKVLKIILKRFGFDWADRLSHYSYGMVELPSGKMKSREGTVVDADDLIEEMVSQAKKISNELGKLNELPKDEQEKTIQKIALGALKYFILKVDPKKNMMFNPAESIDFNGNTGPFIQYSYTRIKSLERKATEANIYVDDYNPNSDFRIDKKEVELLKLIYKFPAVVHDAGILRSPATIANYVYEVAKSFNQFYHDFAIIKENNEDLRLFRLLLASTTGNIIKTALDLLGIEVPERM